jgi:hypothetical protein
VRYQNTVLGDLLKVLPRRRFAASVERHKGDKYIKGFSSWDHLVTLISAQLGGLSSLREVQAVWNAQAAHHYHLGDWADSPLDFVGCQSAAAQRDICRDFCGIERVGGRCAAAPRLGDFAADRCHPDPAYRFA